MPFPCLAGIEDMSIDKLHKGIALLATLAMAMPALASDGDFGRKLHEEHCMECHDSSVYTRGNRIVHSFPELKERIRQCELSNDLAWFDEEIKAVATYLNNNYYHFGKE